MFVTGLSEGSITCSVPPVEIDQDAVLNCSFPEDLNTTKRDFAVYHYPDDKGGTNTLHLYRLL